MYIFIVKKEKFKDIAEAYSILSDPIKKKEYDLKHFGLKDNTSFTNKDIYETFKKRVNEEDEKIKIFKEDIGVMHDVHKFYY